MNMEVIAGVLILLVMGVYFLNQKASRKPTDFNNPKAVIEEANIYIAYGKEKEARELLNRAIQLNPRNVELLNKLNQIQ